MPAATPKYDMNDKTWAADVEKRGDDERTARAKVMVEAWKWYKGDHPDPLKPLPDLLNDNIKYNLVGRGLDKENEFIGYPMRLEVPDGVTETETANGVEQQVSPAQEAADLLYEQIKPKLRDIILSGMVTGHTFLKLFPVDENVYWDGEEDGAPRADFALLDPQIVTVYWEHGRGSRARALWYRCQWTTGDTIYRQDIVPVAIIEPQFNAQGRVLIDHTRGWRVFEYEQAAHTSTWELKFSDEWPLAFPPIIEQRNKSRPHEYYGAPTLTPSLMGLNHAVNFIASNTARIIKFHAHPKTIGVGVEASLVNTTMIDGFFTVPEGSTVENLEMQSDLASSMNMLNEVKAQFFAELRVLDTSSIKDKLGQITNFGVRMMFDDQVELTEELREAYGNLVVVTVWLLAVLENMGLDKPTAKWDDPLPVNRLELLQGAAIEKGLGTTSTQTLAEDLGRDPKVEAERKEREHAEQMEKQEEMMRQAGEQGLLEPGPRGNGNGTRGGFFGRGG
jgi:hypothetical protein